MTSIARPRLSFVLAAITLAISVPFAHAFLVEGKKAPPIKPQMNVLRDGSKSLAKDLVDPKKFDAALDTVMKMEDAVQLAKQGEPPATAKQEKDQKSTFVKDYRKAMIALQQDLLALEVAILDGDTAKAQEIAGKVGDAKAAGHDSFNPKQR